MLWAILPTILEIPSFKNTLNSYFGIELNIQWKKRKGLFFHFRKQRNPGKSDSRKLSRILHR